MKTKFLLLWRKLSKGMKNIRARWLEDEIIKTNVLHLLYMK